MEIWRPALDQDVIWLDITVGDTNSMKVLECIEHLVGENLCGQLWQWPAPINESGEASAWDVVHDDIKVIHPVDMLNESDNVVLGFVSTDFIAKDLEIGTRT